MREGLLRVAREYAAARDEKFRGHPLADFIRQALPARTRLLLGPQAGRFDIRASPGQGQWASSPWVALLDPLVTDTPQRGYYPVYLFNSAFTHVALILGQGTYSVSKEFKNRAPDVLRERAAILRAKAPEAANHFEIGPFNVAANPHHPEDWEISATFGRTYPIKQLPSNEELASDLRRMLEMYALVTWRGGFALVDDDDDSDSEEDEPLQSTDQSDEEYLEGRRRFKFHKRLERRRNAKLVRAVKRHHGNNCAGCGLNFSALYGSVGSNYIDAHHITPLSKLKGDGDRPMDPKKDFAVLCANCHRIIHKLGCPPLEEFRKHILEAYIEALRQLRKQ
jgi:5-methylcytosine-specific restriction protein A